MTDPAKAAFRAVDEMSPTELRRRTVDGRGVADIRLLQVEDGPGRGQRLLVVRNARGIGLEIAVDRGFDISGATWRGINIGWNSANGMPWPPHPVDAEDGVGFYRNFDGFIATCGLDHIGGARRDDGAHYIHKHRRQVFYPLHGRISSQRAVLSGYGIDWSADGPVIWAEGVIRQSAVFGENLVLTRRITLDVYGETIHISDRVENQGYRPTPHAILYHINFGHPFLNESTQISGDVCLEKAAAFNTDEKRPDNDYRDYYEDIPITASGKTASVSLTSETPAGELRVRLCYPREELPAFGIWRAFQSGVYALSIEPARRFDPQGAHANGSVTLQAGDVVKYNIVIALGSVNSDA
ncbi:aldose 1-epimerase family protein [Serratia sp. 1D1416]|uniref:aldose 1-epimerase family protein n=1 Tax=Serratia sp. 1D1416 TaxID=2447890 RepID=UPI001013D1EE|nr:aldose 1-epimerase family protein [Serratia sp. 1D1416]